MAEMSFIKVSETWDDEGKDIEDNVKHEGWKEEWN